MPKKKIKPQMGDVFSISLNDEKFCYGQIVGMDTIIVYDIVGNEGQSIEDIISSSIMFLVHTTDVYIEDGKWHLLGNAPIPEDIKFPQYKTYTLDGYAIIDHNSNILRKASKVEEASLTGKKSYTPNVIEEAVKSKFIKNEETPFTQRFLYTK
ncbi:Imm26 family immunity protein [Paenibacillus sp. SI8]|uniref:Imm26 family immunity protein n=1 Tax=unclassified Paenibacillus TaxID=185978 RepID=UPI003467D55D